MPDGVDPAAEGPQPSDRGAVLDRVGSDAQGEKLCPRHDAVLALGERGVPVTTPARTLFDLAAVVSPDHLEAALHEAEVRRLTSPTSLHALVARYRGHRGVQAVNNVLARHRAIGAPIPTNILERRLLALLDAYHLPRPQINRISDSGELDATWPEHRLIVECDGFATHGTRKAFEADRARDRELVVAGWRVVRITWRQLADDPDAIAQQLAALLR